VPARVGDLSDDERAFLAGLGVAADVDPPASGDAWQALIFTTARDRGLPPGRAFAALYAAFLDRANGPRAGWLLAGLDPRFVLGRLRDAGRLRDVDPGGAPDLAPGAPGPGAAPGAAGPGAAPGAGAAASAGDAS
jgi:hypothetical protein